MDPETQVILNNTVGAMVWGVMVSNLLFGCVTHQVFVYYQKYPQDRWQLKASVAFVWILELSHTICVMHVLYVSTVTRHGRPDFWVIAPTGIIASYFTCLTVTIVQAFYTIRLIKCFNKSYFAVICWVLMSFDFIVLIAFLVMVQKGKGIAPIQWVFACIAGFYVMGGVDLLNSIFLCFYLFTSRRRSSYISTISILDRLIVMTIITGIIMAFMSITVATLIITSTAYDAWYSAVIFCDGEVYSNLFLLSLNTRLVHPEITSSPIRLSQIGTSQVCAPSSSPAQGKLQSTRDSPSPNQVEADSSKESLDKKMLPYHSFIEIR